MVEGEFFEHLPGDFAFFVLYLGLVFGLGFHFLDLLRFELLDLLLPHLFHFLPPAGVLFLLEGLLVARLGQRPLLFFLFLLVHLGLELVQS